MPFSRTLLKLNIFYEAFIKNNVRDEEIYNASVNPIFRDWRHVEKRLANGMPSLRNRKVKGHAFRIERPYSRIKEGASHSPW